jgi:hypothetical protein
MRVFISYRREDTSGQAGRLYDALAEHLGKENVFIDVDTIDLGVEFKQAIESAVSSCDVLFAMIGPRWLTVADSKGERRLNHADDYVRLEIEAALGRNIRVVPALIAGATMPVADDLPGTLEALARRNAVEVSDGPRWQYDVSRIVSLLERVRAGESRSTPSLEPETPVSADAQAPFEAEAPIDPGRRAGETSVNVPDASGDPQAEVSGREKASSASQSRIGASAGERVAPLSARAGGGGGGWEGGSGDGGSGGRSSAGRRSGGLSDAPRWLVALAALGVVSLLAIALVGAYELGKGGHESNNSPLNIGSTSSADTGSAVVTNTTNNPDVPANADADQTKLWLAIPKPIRRGACKLANPEHAGGVATINCDYDDPKHGRTLLHLDRFVDLPHLQLIYRVHGPGAVAARGGAPDPKLKAATGGCNRAEWRGEGPWSHEMGATMGPVSGRYACYQAKGQCDLVAKMKLADINGQTCWVIVWTDLAAKAFVKAEQQTAVHAGVYSFYDFWHHQFG